MKKLVQTSLVYAIAAMAGGVFFREFTKLRGFTGITKLSLVHTHLFLLGMLFFLIAALFALRLDIIENRKFKIFFATYNIGVPITAAMLFLRGVLQVLGTPLSRGLDASISGIAGIGHILTGVGMILFLLCLKENAPTVTPEKPVSAKG